MVVGQHLKTITKVCLDFHLNHLILQSKGKEHGSVTRSKLVVVFCVIYYNIYNEIYVKYYLYIVSMFIINNSMLNSEYWSMYLKVPTHFKHFCVHYAIFNFDLITFFGCLLKNVFFLLHVQESFMGN